MKKIRLQVACRYLQRYGGSLECIHDRQTVLAKRACVIGETTVMLERFTPDKTQVFLKREDKRIAKIVEGLPETDGHFNPETGEFLREIPY